MADRHCSKCGVQGHDRRTCGKHAATMAQVETRFPISNGVSLAVRAVGSSPAPRAEYGRLIQPRDTTRWTGRSFGALEPDRLAGILREAQSGDLENWADLGSYMVRTDLHLRSVYLTRVTAVASADIEMRPGACMPGQEDLASTAADFVLGQLREIEELEDRFADCLHGMGIGVAVLEHDWKVINGVVKSTPRFIHPRDIRYDRDWDLQVRTYVGGVPQWIRVKDHPAKFIVHTPHNIAETPTLTGELMAVAWAWLFKRWLEKYQLDGLERMANGLLYGKVQPGAPQEVRDKMREGLESAAADGVAVFEVDGSTGEPIGILEMRANPGTAWGEAINRYNGEMSKSLLGSGLNVEVGSTGGNRSLGESQFDTTILPRLLSDAKRLAGTWDRDYTRWLLTFNTHLFGGVLPPIPTIVMKVVKDEPKEVVVDQIAIDCGAVTIDELRESRGLEPWGPGRGGDRVVEPANRPPPAGAMFSAAPSPVSRTVPKVDDVPLAKARQRPRQMTLPIFTPSRTNPLVKALSGA